MRGNRRDQDLKLPDTMAIPNRHLYVLHRVGMRT
jgi:hypothetical protein